jgi:hypothetical protein
MRRSSEFDAGEDSGHQQVEWRVEQAGFVMWALILIAALAGLLGPGPLSSVSAASADGSIQAAYHRFARLQAEGRITLRLSPSLVRDGAIRLRINRAFTESAAIERIQPEPREMVIAGEELIYVFPAEKGQATASVEFRFNPARMGVREYFFGHESGAHVRLWTLVLP